MENEPTILHPFPSGAFSATLSGPVGVTSLRLWPSSHAVSNAIVIIMLSSTPRPAFIFYHLVSARFCSCCRSPTRDSVTLADGCCGCAPAAAISTLLPITSLLPWWSLFNAATHPLSNYGLVSGFISSSYSLHSTSSHTLTFFTRIFPFPSTSLRPPTHHSIMSRAPNPYARYHSSSLPRCHLPSYFLSLCVAPPTKPSMPPLGLLLLAFLPPV